MTRKENRKNKIQHIQETIINLERQLSWLNAMLKQMIDAEKMPIKNEIRTPIKI